MTAYAHITKRQQGILGLLYIYRFLSRPQIQAFLGHPHKQQVNLWLKDLWNKGYIEGDYSNKFPDNTKPTIYHAGLGAIAYYKTMPWGHEIVIARLYRDYSRERSYIDKCLLIADLALEVQKQSTAPVTYQLHTSSHYSSPNVAGSFLLDYRLYPDAVITAAVDYRNRAYVVQLFTKGTPDHRQLATLRKYLELSVFGIWKDYTDHESPHYVFAFESGRQFRMLSDYLATLLDELHENDRDKFSYDFVHRDELAAHGIFWLIQQREAYLAAHDMTPLQYIGLKALPPRDPDKPLPAIQRKSPEAAITSGPDS